ncbi:hypothetical protein B0H63DRAFT_517799 [Podospora didyma]|uniref:Transfer RNA methyltransferase 82 n=1 Tax=Podospora didyma TaxID=330526 RepID=A0AAE0P7D6_9PEZI|nr:hypothetical protein B0H63DRAFT_517799 [Podospora didyma]
MAVPYHVLKVCGDVVFAARGSNIYSFNLSLEHLSTWNYPAKADGKPCGSSSVPQAASPAAEVPPSKRRRLEAGQGEGTGAGADIGEASNGNATAEPEVLEVGNRRRKKDKSACKEPNNTPLEKPFVQGLHATTDGRHLVAVTGSDKTIWVFEHDGAGKLIQLSQRMMPKRPCSIVITPDNQTILSADKFGDVYSLPLIPSPFTEEQKQQTSKEDNEIKSADNASKDATPEPSRSATLSTAAAAAAQFKPQANEFTVHTKRNRMALENQKLALELKLAEKSRAAADAAFEHTLLLGHVSMLTAVLVATAPSTGRKYIITADRDEHIRVSRGTPSQAHIIEGFCLGHEDFVSKLCIPTGQPELLISGGGDDDLFLWDWAAGKLVSKANVLQHAQLIESETKKIAIGRLFTCQQKSNGRAWVFVICERIPALFCFQLQDTTLQHIQTIRTARNPLDVDVVKQAAEAAASSSSSSGSLAVLDWAEQDDVMAEQQPVHEGSGLWVKSNATPNGPAVEEDINVSPQELQKILYPTESLRKTAVDFEE